MRHHNLSNVTSVRSASNRAQDFAASERLSVRLGARTRGQIWDVLVCIAAVRPINAQDLATAAIRHMAMLLPTRLSLRPCLRLPARPLLQGLCHEAY